MGCSNKKKVNNKTWCCWQSSPSAIISQVWKIPGGDSKIDCLLSASALTQENRSSVPKLWELAFSFRRSLQETCIRLINFIFAGMPCGVCSSSSCTFYKISALLYCEALQQQHKPFGSNADNCTFLLAGYKQTVTNSCFRTHNYTCLP